MEKVKFFNPFTPESDQSEEISKRIRLIRKREKNARAKFERSTKAYRELISSNAYGPIREDALSALSDCVEQIVQHATKCMDCCHTSAFMAARIEFIREVLLQPIQSVLEDDLKRKAEEVVEEVSS